MIAISTQLGPVSTGTTQVASVSLVTLNANKLYILRAYAIDNKRTWMVSSFSFYSTAAPSISISVTFVTSFTATGAGFVALT